MIRIFIIYFYSTILYSYYLHYNSSLYYVSLSFFTLHIPHFINISIPSYSYQYISYYIHIILLTRYFTRLFIIIYYFFILKNYYINQWTHQILFTSLFHSRHYIHQTTIPLLLKICINSIKNKNILKNSKCNFQEKILGTGINIKNLAIIYSYRNTKIISITSSWGEQIKSSNKWLIF